MFKSHVYYECTDTLVFYKVGRNAANKSKYLWKWAILICRFICCQKFVFENKAHVFDACIELHHFLFNIYMQSIYISPKKFLEITNDVYKY